MIIKALCASLFGFILIIVGVSMKDGSFAETITLVPGLALYFGGIITTLVLITKEGSR